MVLFAWGSTFFVARKAKRMHARLTTPRMWTAPLLAVILIPSPETDLARDPKITPITRHEPRTFYATRVTRTQAGESWDLWSVEDGRRIGFLSVVDDGHVVY